MKFWDKLSIRDKILALIVMAELLLIFFTNLFCMPGLIDGDSAKLLTHLIKMWEHKTPAIRGWSYVSTLEWDCVTIFALPIYGLTKNIYFSCAVANELLAILFVFTIWFILSDKPKYVFLSCVALLLVPYSLGMLEYYNMMFFGVSQYIVKVMTPLMFVGLLLHEEKSKTKTIMTAIFLVLLLCTSASSGTYIAMCGLFPVIAVYLIERFFAWKKIPKDVLSLFCAMIPLMLIGWAVNKRLIGVTKAGSLNFTSMYVMLGWFSACFWGMFELFGAATRDMDFPVVSAKGALLFEKSLFVLVLVWNAFMSIREVVAQKADRRKLFLISMFVWNYIILTFVYVKAGSETFEYRYHLVGIIPLVILFVIRFWEAFHDWKLNAKQEVIFLITLLSGFLIMLGGSYVSVYTMEDPNEELKCLVRECEKTDVKLAYLFNESNEADICRFLAIDKMVFLDMLHNGNSWAYDYYGAPNDTPVITEGTLLAVNTQKFHADTDIPIPEGYELEQICIIQNYELYRFKQLE